MKATLKEKSYSNAESLPPVYHFSVLIRISSDATTTSCTTALDIFICYRRNRVVILYPSKQL